MENYEDVAIEAIKEYVINLLQNREWCKARRIGKALEILVEGRADGGDRIGIGVDTRPTCESTEPLTLRREI